MNPKTKKWLMWGGGAIVAFFLGRWIWRGTKAVKRVPGVSVSTSTQPMMVEDAPVPEQMIPQRLPAAPVTSIPLPPPQAPPPDSDSFAAKVKAAVSAGGGIVVHIPKTIPGTMTVIPPYVQTQMDKWDIMNATRRSKGLPELPKPTPEQFATGQISIAKVGM